MLKDFDAFESYVWGSIKQGNYDSLIANTKMDFSENSIQLHGEMKVEEILLVLKKILYSSDLTIKEKHKYFIGIYNKYESQKKMVDLLTSIQS